MLHLAWAASAAAQTFSALLGHASTVRQQSTQRDRVFEQEKYQNELRKDFMAFEQELMRETQRIQSEIK